MNTPQGVLRLAVALTAAVAVVVPALPAHAAASDAGLYGAADPTYDGVYRQSLAIMGQTAHTLTPPAIAIDWLLDQQCADGSFEAYRADTTKPCGRPDPVNYSGPDTNSTGMAFQALMSLDNGLLALSTKRENQIVDAAVAAAKYLQRTQNADGGWPYYAGGASDANSTGVVLGGFNSWGGFQSSKAYKRAVRFLGTVAASCADGGGFAYQSGSKPDGSATSQGTLGIVGGLPGSRQPRPAAAAACANTAKAKGISYLASGLRPTGLLPSSLGGTDYTSTATAVIALAQARQGRAAIAKGVSALKANARAYATPATGTNAGATGLLMMVAANTGTKPTAFGGLNLVTTLNASLRK